MITLLSLLIFGSVTHYENTSQWVVAEVTGYTSSIEETDSDPHITASGERTRDGILACPERLAFGTKVVIEGKEYECQDRMNKRYRSTEHYDIWFPSKDLALEWGRKTLSVKID